MFVSSPAVYISQFQLLPLGQTCEPLEDLYHCHVSEATMVSWIAKAANQLEPTIKHLKTLLIASSLQHADETDMRIKGLLTLGSTTLLVWKLRICRN